VQNKIPEGRVDVKAAIVSNEAHLCELFHEKVDPGTCCPDHFRE
jgi:hypothetical protein